MKSLATTALLIGAFTLVACGSKQKSSSESSNYNETPANFQPAAETADVSFHKSGKELGKLEIEDTDSGITATFSSKKLQKGKYEILLVDTCKAAKKSKNSLPEKDTQTVLTEFTATSAETAVEFTKPGMSIGERFLTLGGKSISLVKKGKKNATTKVACSTIEKR